MASSPLEVIHRLIESDFKTYWTANASGVPIAWENVPFTQPATGIWIQFTVRFAGSQQASLGRTPLEKITGVVFINVFTPKGTGARQAARLADVASRGLRYKQLSGDGVAVSLRSPALLHAGEQVDYYQADVSVEFVGQHIAAVAA